MTDRRSLLKRAGVTEVTASLLSFPIRFFELQTDLAMCDAEEEGDISRS
jgi:hypothetical protein